MKNSQKGFAVPLLIVIAVLVIGGIALFESGLFSNNIPDINEIPMYGFSSYEQYLNQRTPKLAKINDDFVNEILADHNGSQMEASDSACDEGFKYINSDDVSTAMKRFNQGWLIDHTNPCVFAGYGYIYGKTDDYNKAMTNYSNAIQLATSDNPKYWWIYTNYSEMMTRCYHFSKERVDCLAKAEENINIALKLSDAPKVHRTLVLLDYEKEDYTSAWSELHKMIDVGTNDNEFITGFTQVLSEKMADPFKK